jgi:hypothetical protein
MQWKTLLWLQVLYALLGIAYNGVSIYYASVFSQPLAPTKPLLGIMTMLVYALFLLPGYLGKTVFYRVLMALAVIVIGYGGVVTHLINIFSQPQLYSSLTAWSFAVGINLFGLVLNITAALGKFKK